MAKRDEHTGNSGQTGMAINTCEACENKEFCPVYMGQNCLLVKEHNDLILDTERNTE